MEEDRPQPLKNYESIESVPTPCTAYCYDRLDDERNCTDICCCGIGILFTLVMLLFAIFGMETGTLSAIITEKYVKSNFPTDSEGRLCGVDLPAYPYVYFSSPPEIVSLTGNSGKKSMRGELPEGR